MLTRDQIKILIIILIILLTFIYFDEGVKDYWFFFFLLVGMMTYIIGAHSPINSIFSIFNRLLIIIFILSTIGLAAPYIYKKFTIQDHQKFIAAEDIKVSTPTDINGERQEFPIYAENNDFYFILNPVNYYQIAKKNNCPQFNPKNRSTWCGDERYLPKCYPSDSACESIISREELGLPALE